MEKAEIVDLMRANGVRSTNVKTFCNKNRKLNINPEKAAKWLSEVEAKTFAEAVKEMDKKNAKLHKLSYKKYLELRTKAECILADFHTGHSMGCFRWLATSYLFASKHDLRDYAKSCKYQAKYGSLTIYMTMKELRDISLVDGRWTVGNKFLQGRGYKSNYTVEWVNI